MNKIETTILKNLLHDEDFMRKTLPFLKEDYFVDNAEKMVFKNIASFVEKYNKAPTVEALEISIQNSLVNETVFKDTVDVVSSIKIKEQINLDWLLHETEKFCKDKAVYNAILKSISILDGNDKQYNKEAIPNLLQDALSVCFDNSVGLVSLVCHSDCLIDLF